ncbi:cyclic nucleotide-binding domain-containing protein [Thiospirochaeta perfilievii]|uniref:Cyclic nucleotide-binding domain-containing protein n=1 Tax=Thiospirochaeta perfilievii TaxID=252967 RepID=A0A5C1Q844_9SPIO|nr:cyclic nucleotide-binding domain-containing protein [Thiospirochaeta perfilievii]QEN03577.1 cyclic nucleotide-binding domain-containing protein [Thiospirochaeta perfilievii]
MSNAQLGIMSCRKGAYITTIGENKADCFYIIRSGSVRVTREIDIKGESKSIVLKPGDFFGVVSTMSHHPHIDTAQAIEDTKIITVKKDQFQFLIQNNTAVAMNIINGFSKRVRVLNKELVRKSGISKQEIGPETLYSSAEVYIKSNRYNEAYFLYNKYISESSNSENIKKAKLRMERLKPYAKSQIALQGDTSFVRHYPKDCMIFGEGQKGTELYILQKGQVKITKIVENKEIILAILKAGDMFGEMALLEDKPRSASAISYENADLMVISRSNFKKMVSEQPQIVTKLTILLADRIWGTTKLIENANISDYVGRLYDWLSVELEKMNVPLNTKESAKFNFGIKELINIVGIPRDKVDESLVELYKNHKISEKDGKLHSSDVSEIRSQCAYYRKMDRIKKNRI